MSNDQLHGKTWENIMKAGFPGASDAKRSHTSRWDIEPKYDREFGYPTMLETIGISEKSKSKKPNPIYLADARKVWDINFPYRLLVGVYRQQHDLKVFFQVIEALIYPEQHLKLLGEVSLKQVRVFHDSIQRDLRPEDEEARKFAKDHKAENLANRSLIQLNPKIKGSQRRVQCSLYLSTLIETLPEAIKVYREGEYYRGISVDVSLKSSRREFRR